MVWSAVVVHTLSSKMYTALITRVKQCFNCSSRLSSAELLALQLLQNLLVNIEKLHRNSVNNDT